MAPPGQDFLHIGPRASLYTPTESIPGQLIIICTWLGASRKHIAKYTTLYQRIASGARILLVESNVPILVSSYSYQRSQIQCAVSAVLDTLSESGFTIAAKDSTVEKKPSSSPVKPPKIILHAFSNGGTNTATQLLIELRKRLAGPLPLTGIVLDSCPAKGTYWRSYNAMVLSLPPGAGTRLLGALAVHFLLVLLYTWIACGNENPASLMRRTLLDNDTVYYSNDTDKNVTKDLRHQVDVSNEAKDQVALGVPSTDSEEATLAGSACYLYSKSDKMVEWTDIRDHAEDARHKGWHVKEVLFDGSAHCAHMSLFEDQYVKAVEAMWQTSTKSGVNSRAPGAISARL